NERAFRCIGYGRHFNKKIRLGEFTVTRTKAYHQWLFGSKGVVSSQRKIARGNIKSELLEAKRSLYFVQNKICILEVARQFLKVFWPVEVKPLLCRKF